MKLIAIICLMVIILSINAKRYYIIPYIMSRDLLMERSEARPRYILPEPEVKPQPSEKYENRGNRGRVLIKVYRGPDEGDHAPHGYWVRQPADNY